MRNLLTALPALPLLFAFTACGEDSQGEARVVVSKQEDIGRMVTYRGQIFFLKQTSNAVASARPDSSTITVEAEGIASPVDIAATNDAIVVCARGGGEGLRGIVRIDGGALELLADLPCTSLAIHKQQVYFSHEDPSGLSRIPLRGGAVENLASVDSEIGAIEVTETEIVTVTRSGEVFALSLDSGEIRDLAVEQGDLQEVVTDGRVAYWVGNEGVMAYIADHDEPLLLAEGNFDPNSLAILPQEDTFLYAARNDQAEHTVVAIQTRAREIIELTALDESVGAMGIDRNGLYWSEPSSGQLIYLPLASDEL